MTAKIMFSFPDQLVVRMKAAIPQRERSKIIAILLEKEISLREQNLYQCAKEVEESSSLKEEMMIWDKEFGQDGLNTPISKHGTKRHG